MIVCIRGLWVLFRLNNWLYTGRIVDECIGRRL